jgi:ABC-type nitrate/sulfonate/bicarbonate transport system substrate-binding protein
MVKRTRITALAGVMLLLAACAAPGATPSPAGTPGATPGATPDATPGATPVATPGATPMETIPFREGFIPGLNHLPEVVAAQYAADFGLELETVNFTTVPDTITAIARNDIDIMMNTPSTAISGRDQGIALVVVGGGYHRGTSLVVAGDLDLGEEDWDGLRAAVEEASAAGQPLRLGAAASVSTNWVECYFTLQDNGIDPETDLEIVNIPAFGEHPGALGRGDVDMVCTSEPFATLSQTIGGGTFFAHPFDTPAGESLGALVTTEEVLADEQRREGVRRYVALYDHAVQLINSDPELAVRTAMEIMQTDDRELAERALAATKFDVGFNKQEFQELARMHNEIGHTNQDWSGQIDVWTNEEFVNELD